MINSSPQIANLEACVCGSLFFFYLYHSYRYDRFRGMRIWKPAYRSGRFHVAMRLLYFLGLPIFAGQAAVLAQIKYTYGFFPVKAAEGGPIPYLFWRPTDRSSLLPIFICQALGWGAETAVHLEELCFWWFLLHLSMSSRPWLSSWPFRIFIGGSIGTTIILLIIVVTQQDDYFQLAALLYFVSAIAGLAITLAFIRVTVMFPTWLDTIQRAGAPVELVIRLYSFGQMNILRVIARVIFGVPMLILAIDGLTPQKHINRIPWLVDTFIIIENLAFACQAVITLIVFLPRSYVVECGYEVGMLSTELAPDRPVRFLPLVESPPSTNPSSADSPQTNTLIIKPLPQHIISHPAIRSRGIGTWSQDGVAQMESGIAESPGLSHPKGSYHQESYSQEDSAERDSAYEGAQIRPTSPLRAPFHNFRPESRLHPAIRFFKSPIDPVLTWDQSS